MSGGAVTAEHRPDRLCGGDVSVWVDWHRRGIWMRVHCGLFWHSDSDSDGTFLHQQLH